MGSGLNSWLLLCWIGYVSQTDHKISKPLCSLITHDVVESVVRQACDCLSSYCVAALSYHYAMRNVVLIQNSFEASRYEVVSWYCADRRSCVSSNTTTALAADYMLFNAARCVTDQLNVFICNHSKQ